MYSVDLINLTKKWGSVTAVNDINLHIAEGEFVVLLGPSGCGKTTTMRLVAGLEEITTGEIKIGDQVVNEIDPRKKRCFYGFPKLQFISSYECKKQYCLSIKNEKNSIYRTRKKDK